MSGENQDNPHLGTNGVGKSTLFDALMWVLFGYTAQGQRGFQVVGTHGEEVSAEVIFFRNDASHTLKRISRSKEMRLLLDQKPAAQEDIDRLIGKDRSEWLKSVYFSQGSTGFLDWTPSARMDFLQGYLQLEIWERMRVRLSDGRDRLENSISSLTGEETALTKACVFLAPVLAEEDWGARALKIQTEMDAIGEEQPLPQRPPERPERPRLTEENTILGSLAARREAVERSLLRYRNLDGPTCPLCGNVIDPETISSEIDKISPQLNSIAVYERSVREIIESKTRAYQTEFQRVSNAQAEFQKLEREHALRVERRADLERKLSEIGFAREQQEQTRHKINQIKLEIERIQKERIALSRVLDQHLFWLSRIKPLQMSCVEGFLDHLNYRIAGILPEIGMKAWTVSLKTTKVKANSTIKPELSVCVGNRDNTDVPWIALSGGEKQRLRLAVLLALVPLFEASFNIMIFDEPATGISPEGLDRFIEVAARRAQEQGKVVFLIDHWLLESEHFSGRLWLTKTREGTCIEHRS